MRELTTTTISVVSIVAKVLEKIVAEHLSSFLKCHHVMHDLQGAYHHRKSAVQIFLYTTDTIVQAIDATKFVCAALRKGLTHLIITYC